MDRKLQIDFMKTKQILEEIYNIKKMMNKLDSSLILVEQGEMWRSQSELQNKGINVEMGDGTKITDDYERVDIGPGTDYPTMMTIVIPIMRELNKPPQLKSFTPGTTGKNFIKDVKTFKKGDLLSDGSPAPEGQEYIVNNDYKLCLPSKKWWDEHTNNNYVYQFKNPKNGKTFNLKLNLSKGNVIVNDKKVSAYKAATMCSTNSNGWTFLESNDGKMASMIFYESKTNKPYNPSNPENFTTESDFDTWWKDNSWWVEVTVGVIAAVLSGGAAAGLIAMAEAGSLGASLGGLVLTLSDAAFMGTGTSWLTVLSESLVEASLMTPIASVYLSEGDEVNAILAIAFSFLPFFTNIPKVSKYIKRGRIFTSDVTDSLLKKINSSGGTKRLLSMTEEESGEFLETLTKDENDALVSVFKMFDEDPEGLKESIEIVLREHSDEILKGFEKSADSKIVTKVKSKLNRWLNPVRGRGVLPQFVRAAIPIGGASLVFNYSYNYLKNQGLSEDQINEVGNELQKNILESDYVKLLNKLDVAYTQKEFDDLQKKIFENKSVSDQIKIIKESGVIEKDFIKPAVEKAGKEQAKQMIQRLQQHYEQILKNNDVDLEMAKLAEEYNIMKLENTIKKQFKIFTEKNVTDIIKNDKSWDLYTDTGEKGKVDFIDDTYKMYLDDKLISEF